MDIRKRGILPRNTIRQATPKNVIEILNDAMEEDVNADDSVFFIGNIENSQEHVKTVKRACEVLTELTLSLQGQEAAIEAGAPEAIVRAMNKYIRDKGIVKSGCIGLANIAYIYEGRMAVIHAGAPNVIVEAMDIYSDDADISKMGCGVLGQISAIPATKKAVVDAGGAEAIVTAISKHIDRPGVADWGCGALGNIVDKYSDGQEAAIEAGAREVLVSVIDKHMENKNIVLKAFNAFKALLEIKISISARGKADYVRDIINRVMRKYDKDDYISYYGPKILKMLPPSSKGGRRKNTRRQRSTTR